MVEKVIGAEMTCKSCGTDLVCKMSDYKGKYEDVPQWQNADGTAHYKRISEGKYDCIIPKDEDVQLAINSLASQESSPPKPTLDIPETDEITASHIDKQLILISQIEKKVISYLENDVVPAKIGLYVKLIYEGIVRQ